VVAVMAAALVTGFTIPIAIAAHSFSDGALVTAAEAHAACKQYGHRHHHHPCRSSSPSPGPTTTSSSPSPSDTSSSAPAATSSPPSPPPPSTSSPPPPGGTACVTSEPSGNCGPYHYAGITNSNGFNTYVANNCWADPSCHQTVTAHDPGNWSLSTHEPAGNTAGKTYPDIPKLTKN